jgi:hypothetical protein
MDAHDHERDVLTSLRDHPHDDTPGAVAHLLGIPVAEVDRALRALESRNCVIGARGHRQLTHPGWVLARELTR